MTNTTGADLATGLCADLEALCRRHRVPGLSIAVLRDQEVAFARGIGFADLEHCVPITADTPCNLASCTKPFAAVILMQLVEAGLLDLDALVSDVLRDTVFPIRYRTPDGAWAQLRGYKAFCQFVQSSPLVSDLWQNYHWDTEPITVRHLLRHTAEGVPGESYHYNGEVYGLLSNIAEQVTGIDFSELLVERIIRPLGMTRTVPSISPQQREWVLGERTQFYRVDEQGAYQRVEVNVPIRWPAEFAEAGVDPRPSMLINAGNGMVSTVLDLAKFDAALDRNRLVSEQTREAMFTAPPSRSGKPLPYGLGWFVQQVKGVRLIWHYGYGDHHSSLLLKVPGE